MPYNNDANRKVARDNSYFVKRFVEHTDALGTSQTINYPNPSVVGGNRVIGGGVGCAEWHVGSARNVDEPASKCPCGGDDDDECLCGGTNLGRKSKDPVGVSLTGGAILGLQDNTLAGEKTKVKVKKSKKATSFGSLGNSLSANLAVQPPEMPAAQAVRASAVKDRNSPLEAQTAAQAARIIGERQVDRIVGQGAQVDETSSPLRRGRGKGKKKGGNGFASGTHMDTGEGPATLGVKPRKTRAKKEGSGVLGTSPFKQGVVENVVEFVKKLVRPRKSRASKLGEIVPGSERPNSKKEDPGHAAVKKLAKRAVGLGKKQETRTPSGDPLLPTSEQVTVQSTPKATRSRRVVKSELPSSTLSGLGKVKKANPRAEVVKRVMSERGIGMIAASKAVKSEGLY